MPPYIAEKITNEAPTAKIASEVKEKIEKPLATARKVIFVDFKFVWMSYSIKADHNLSPEFVGIAFANS